MGGGVARFAAVAAVLTLAGLGLSACAPADRAAETGPPSAAAAEACQAAVAAHVGKPADAVAVDWLETRTDGVEVFEALDAGRRHTCDVDASGAVLRLDHPAE